MSRAVTIPCPKHRTPVDIRVHRDDREIDEEEEKYLEQLSLIKFPTTPQIVAPLNVNFDIGNKGAYHVTTKNKGPDMEKGFVVPTSSGLSYNVASFHSKQAVVADKVKKGVVGAVNQAAGMKLGNGSNATEVKTLEEQNEEDDKLTQDLLECKDVLARKEIADPEDIRRATSLLYQASVRLTTMGYRKTHSEREGSSSSSCSSLSDKSAGPKKKTKDNKKKRA